MCISKELHILLFSLCDLCRIGFQRMGEKRIYCDRYIFSSCQTRGEVDTIVLIPENEVINILVCINASYLTLKLNSSTHWASDLY